MKIRYKKGHSNFNLIGGIFWLAFGLFGIFIIENPYWTAYGYLVLSIFYLIMYFYQKQNGYLKIKNGILKETGLFGKKINLTEIRQIKKFAGDYILKTDEKEFTINTQILDPNSLADLNTVLEKLNLKLN